MSLPEPVRHGLVGVARRLEDARVTYQVGGSAMLKLRGFDVSVGDIDVVVSGSDRSAIDSALTDLAVEVPARKEPWRTDWLIRAQLEVPGGAVGLDVMGGLALIIDGVVARFPLVVEMRVAVDGREIPLAPLAHWYHLYRVHDPAKAVAIRRRLDETAIEEAARALSMG